MPWAALIPLITTGISAATGALANRKAARTATSNANTQSTQRTSSTQSSRRVLSDNQAALQQPLYSEALRRITDPASVVAPLRAGVRENINASYSGVPDLLRSKYTPGAGGQSGKLGKAATRAELARLGALGGADNDFAKLIFDVQNSGLDFGRSLYGMNEGTDVSSTGSQTSQGTQSGTQVGAGDPLAGGLTGGLQMFTLLNTLNQFLNGGKGGGSSPGIGVPGSAYSTWGGLFP